MNKKALVLDLDDTLYAELDFLYSAYRYISERLSPNNTNELFYYLINLYHEGKNAFEYITDNYEIKLTTLLDWYRYHTPNIKLLTGVKEILIKFSLDYKFAVVTDGRSISQRNKIKALGIESFLDCIVISEEINSEKPSLKNFKLVEETLKCDKYIYMGDNPKKDFITPNKLGWETICLKDSGKNIHKQNFDISSDFLPHIYISEWSELNTIL